MSARFHAVRVYLDVQTVTYADKITRLSQELCRHGAYSVVRPPTGSKAFIPVWEQEKNDPQHSVHDAVPPLMGFECFVTECQSLSDADVAYALYCRRLPVLCLNGAPGASDRSVLRHPLLETLETLACIDPLEAAKRFFTFPPDNGRVIVFEGGDGAGKHTQTMLLVDRLKREGRRCETLDFPHDRAQYGPIIRKVLAGKSGGGGSVNPMLFSALYSVNRHDSLPQMRYWLHRGVSIILDRYMTANFGHQASKLADDDARNQCIAALRAFEVEWLGLPEANLVLYLDLPPKEALLAMKADAARSSLDIHELAPMEYKERVRQTFLWCCSQLPRWRCVPCLLPDGTRIPAEDLHAMVYALVQEELE